MPEDTSRGQRHNGATGLFSLGSRPELALESRHVQRSPASPRVHAGVPGLRLHRARHADPLRSMVEFG